MWVRFRGFQSSFDDLPLIHLDTTHHLWDPWHYTAWPTNGRNPHENGAMEPIRKHIFQSPSRVQCNVLVFRGNLPCLLLFISHFFAPAAALKDAVSGGSKHGSCRNHRNWGFDGGFNSLLGLQHLRLEHVGTMGFTPKRWFLEFQNQSELGYPFVM